MNIFFFQFTFELCNFSQDIFKTMLWMIISTISKINYSWCFWIAINNGTVSSIIRIFNFLSSITWIICDFFNFWVMNFSRFINCWNMKFSVAFEFINALKIRSLIFIWIYNFDIIFVVLICCFLWIVAFNFLMSFISKKFVFFSNLQFVKFDYLFNFLFCDDVCKVFSIDIFRIFCELFFRIRIFCIYYYNIDFNISLDNFVCQRISLIVLISSVDCWNSFCLVWLKRILLFRVIVHTSCKILCIDVLSSFFDSCIEFRIISLSFYYRYWSCRIFHINIYLNNFVVNDSFSYAATWSCVFSYFFIIFS